MKRISRLLLFALLPAGLYAHDTWLVPAAFRTQPGRSVRLRLATSEAFPSSEVAVVPDRVARFTHRGTWGTQPVEGYRVEGTFLVADVAPSRTGHFIVVAETKPRAFVLEPKIFNQYLQEEELTAVLAARTQKGQTDSPGRERYRKIAKTILCVGDAADSAYARADGLWLEIVPEASTCNLRVGDSLTVRVLFENQPLAGAQLGAGYEGVTGHHYAARVRTDKQGRATVPLDRPGVWFVRVLHMVPASQDPEADWHSAFSTLTFEVQTASAVRTTGKKVKDSAEGALRELLNAQVGAWNLGDIDGFLEGYWKSDETTFSGSQGVLRGWQALRERYRSSYADRAAMGRLEFSNLEITPLGPDAAMILGRWQLKREKDSPGGVFTLVARRFAEGWRIVHDHTSLVTPPAPPTR